MNDLNHNTSILLRTIENFRTIENDRMSQQPFADLEAQAKTN